MALLGLLFSNVSLAATPQDDIQCKVEQDQSTPPSTYRAS